MEARVTVKAHIQHSRVQAIGVGREVGVILVKNSITAQEKLATEFFKTLTSDF